MLFILIAHDKPGAQPLRMATRPAHIAFCEQQIGEKLLFGGPMVDSQGQPTGSILVIEAEDEAQARKLFEADPYQAVGLFADSTVSRFRQVFANGKQL